MDSRQREKLRKYFAQDLGWGWARNYQAKRVFDFLIEAADFCRGGIVLDAGAGHQRYRPFFDQSLYLSQEHESGVNFKGMNNINYDLISPVDVKIPLKDNCLDGVLSTSVIEHMENPREFCKEAYRVLKPGGKLFINVPFSIIEHERPFDFTRPTRYALKKWMEEAGFSDFLIEPSSSCTETVCNVLPITVYCDFLQTDQGYKKNLAENFASSKNIIVKLYYTFRVFVAAILYLATKILSFLLKLLIDRGPYDKALLPVGWIVVATKQGKITQNSKTPDRKTFLAKFALADKKTR